MAGLPNITGYWNNSAWINPDSSSDVGGCIYLISGTYNNYTSGGGGLNSPRRNIDASRSSSIYGSSTTVTPLSESVIMCIKH